MMLRRLAATLTGCAALACGGKDGPVQPATGSIQLVAGGGEVSTALQARPLSVKLLDGRGRPTVGANVSFLLVSGTGSLGATIATTDATGTAQTTWALGASADTQIVRVQAPQSTDLEVKGVVTVAGIGVSRVTAWLGVTQEVRPTLVDALGTVLTSSSAPIWTSADENTAAITSAGRITAFKTGSTTLTVRTAQSRTASVTVDVAAPSTALITLKGGVTLAGEGTTDPMRFYLRTGNITYSVPLDATGAFTLPTDVTSQSIEMYVDEDGGRRYHPAYLRTTVGALPATPQTITVGRFVMIPRRWTITQGSFAGASVNISMSNAFAPPCPTVSDQNCDGYYPVAWFSGIKLWDDASLPIPVALNHGLTNESLNAADSIALWSTLDKMSADLGVQVFRPAQYQDLVPLDVGWADKAVLVRIDTTLTGFSGFTNWRWAGDGNLFAATVRLRRKSLIPATSLISHELLHALGFKHSCSWSTVMGGYGCSSVSSLSMEDVAYWQLARHVRNLQRATGAPYGVVEALQGERVLMLGRSPYTPGTPFLLSRLTSRGLPFFEDMSP